MKRTSTWKAAALCGATVKVSRNVSVLLLQRKIKKYRHIRDVRNGHPTRLAPCSYSAGASEQL